MIDSPCIPRPRLRIRAQLIPQCRILRLQGKLRSDRYSHQNQHELHQPRHGSKDHPGISIESKLLFSGPTGSNFVSDEQPTRQSTLHGVRVVPPLVVLVAAHLSMQSIRISNDITLDICGSRCRWMDSVRIATHMKIDAGA